MHGRNLQDDLDPIGDLQACRFAQVLELTDEITRPALRFQLLGNGVIQDDQPTTFGKRRSRIRFGGDQFRIELTLAQRDTRGDDGTVGLLSPVAGLDRPDDRLYVLTQPGPATRALTVSSNLPYAAISSVSSTDFTLSSSAMSAVYGSNRFGSGTATVNLSSGNRTRSFWPYVRKTR